MGSKISNTEWGLVIGALLVVDGVQALLNFFAVGVLVNRFINIFVGMMIPLYLKLRGVKLDTKKIGSMIGGFGLEMIPVFDFLPVWTAIGVRNMMLDKADKKLKKSGGQAQEQGNQQPVETQK